MLLPRTAPARGRLTALVTVAAALVCSGFAAAAARAQGGLQAPYSFLVAPNDQIGVPGYPYGSVLTPTGDLFTGWTEFYLRVGNPRRGFSPSIRQLEGGRYPVVQSAVRSGDLVYTQTAFAAPVSGQLVDFVRVEALNVGSRPAKAAITASVRNNGAPKGSRGASARQIRVFRFPRPALPSRTGLYSQPGEAFNKLAVYSFQGRTLIRDGKVLYDAPAPPKGFTLLQNVNPGGTTTPIPASPFGQSVYTGSVAPGTRVALDFRVPVQPPVAGSAEYNVTATAGFDAFHQFELASWKQALAPAMKINLPEPKVVDTFYAGLVAELMPRYQSQDDGSWIQAVNEARYHAFWLRDAAFMNHSLDVAGLHAIARQNLDFFLTWQQPDGLFISRPNELDGIGEALWAFGDHFARTGDRAFARKFYPSIQAAMGWIHDNRAQDPLGLIPSTARGDNEHLTGHITGDDLLAVDGIDGMITIARALGHDDDVAAWTAERQSLKAALDRALGAATAHTGGWAPPALDADGGQDWGNLWLSYPQPVYPPQSGVVTNTLAHVRSKFREGIATYLDTRLLHAYLGFRVFETDLQRGDQQNAVAGLYAELAHTTATNSGFETNVAPLGTRTVSDTTTPHGWWAGEYVSFLRDMLVREDGDAVVLMSALSPAWLAPGQVVSVSGAPTTHGTVSFRLVNTSSGAVLTWKSTLPVATQIRWPVPVWVRNVAAPGLSSDGSHILLKGASGRLKVSWRRRPSDLSFATAADQLEAQYARAARAGHISRSAPRFTGSYPPR